MHVRVLSVGGKVQAWVADAWQRYAKRLPPAWRTELVELPPGRRSPRQPAEEVRAAEARRLRTALRDGEYVVVLDEGGQLLDSGGFAARLEEWLGEARDLVFVIGGADGLDHAFLYEAQFRWSLSPMTFPHEMVRVILAEQLYRASSIIAGHPYHRG